jgi:hypothetical protein
MRLICRAGVKFRIEGAIITATEEFEEVAGIKAPILLTRNQDIHFCAPVVKFEGARVYGTDRKSGVLEVTISEAVNSVLGGRDFEIFLIEPDPLVSLGGGRETAKAENQQKIGPPHLWRC